MPCACDVRESEVVAGQARAGDVGKRVVSEQRLGNRRELGLRNLVVAEGALVAGVIAIKRVEDGAGEQLAEVAVAHRLRSRGVDLLSLLPRPVAFVVGHEEKLVLAVVDFRYGERASNGEAKLILLEGRL